MDKYAVTVKRTLVLVTRLEVEAESEKDALKKARDLAKERGRWGEEADTTMAGPASLVLTEDEAVGA